jgi:uncharacterized protein (TIGR02466 family)
MIRELHFPTPIYIFDHNDPSLNVQLEKDIMNRAHQHPNSLWSGVYYVKAPQNSGHLKVDDPRSSASMIRPKQKSGQLPPRLFRETHYEPKAGRCIMFPAWLTHCVDPNESNDIRISVSFNFLQKGMFV